MTALRGLCHLSRALPGLSASLLLPGMVLLDATPVFRQPALWEAM